MSFWNRASLLLLFAGAVAANPIVSLAQSPFDDQPVAVTTHAAATRLPTQADGPDSEPQTPRQTGTADREALILEKFVAQNVDIDGLVSLLPGLSPALKAKVLERVRFAVLQENRTDLQPLLNSVAASARTKPQLSTENMLGIPMRPGKLEISAMFIKKYGTIMRSDRSGFEAQLDAISVNVVPDPKNPGRVLATFAGTTAAGQPVQQPPVGGKITTDGNTGLISTDDGQWIKIVWQSNGTYKISSSKLPVTATAKYCD